MIDTQRGSEKVSRRGPEAPEAFQMLDQARIIEKTNEFLMIFIENMQKALLFQCKMLMGLPRTPPRRGPKIGIRSLKVAPRTSESLIFHKLAALKSGCLKL